MIIVISVYILLWMNSLLSNSTPRTFIDGLEDMLALFIVIVIVAWSFLWKIVSFFNPLAIILLVVPKELKLHDWDSYYQPSKCVKCRNPQNHSVLLDIMETYENLSGQDAKALWVFSDYHKLINYKWMFHSCLQLTFNSSFASKVNVSYR